MVNGNRADKTSTKCIPHRRLSRALVLWTLVVASSPGLSFATGQSRQIDPVRDAMNREAERRRQQQQMEQMRRAAEQRNSRNQQGQNSANSSTSSAPDGTGTGPGQSETPVYSWMSESVYVTGPSGYSDKRCVKALIKAEKSCESGPALLGRLASRYAQAMAQGNLHLSCQIAEETRVASANTNSGFDGKCKKHAKAAKKICFIKKSKRHKRAKELEKLAAQARAQAAIIASYRLGSSCQAETAAVSNCQTIEDLRTKPECRFSLCEVRFRDQPECQGGGLPSESPVRYGDQGAPTMGTGEQSSFDGPSASPNSFDPSDGDSASQPVLAPNGGMAAGSIPYEGVTGLSVQHGTDRIGVSADSGFRMIGAAYLRLREKNAFLDVP